MCVGEYYLVWSNYIHVGLQRRETAFNRKTGLLPTRHRSGVDSSSDLGIVRAEAAHVADGRGGAHLSEFDGALKLSADALCLLPGQLAS